MGKIAEQKSFEAYPPHWQNLAGDGYYDMSLERREGYAKGYDQALQDFMEKACDYLQKNLWRVEDGEFRQRFVTDFKNYMQDEE